MDFTKGVNSSTGFPKDVSVMSMKKLDAGAASSVEDKLSQNNYSGPGNISSDLDTLSQCMVDAEKTNYFFVGGTLRSNMYNWKNFSNRLDWYKKNMGISYTLSSAVSRYNNNLREAKRVFVLGKAIGAVQTFNNSKYVKSRSYKQEKNEDGKWVDAKDANGNKIVSSESYYNITQSSDVYSMVSTMKGYNGRKDIDNTTMSFSGFDFGWMSKINE